jgi:hypothetical protein
VELDLPHFLNDVFHASRFLGQDTGVIKLNAMTQVRIVLCPKRFIWVVKFYVPMVLFNHGLGMPGSSNIDLATFAGDAVHARCF